MIYLKNIREKQTVYIPRTEINSKVVVIKSYDEGYADGIVEGKKLQKLKLTNLTVSENGVYKREDGWNEVKVDVPDIPSKTQKKTLYVTKNTDVVLPDEGYDGLSQVNINATQYGQDKRNEGYEDGYNAGNKKGYADGKTEGIAIQKSKLTNLSVTANGTYERTDGWNKINVNVPSQTLKLQQKNITLTKDIETVTPSTGYDGLTKVGIDATSYVKTKRDEGYAEGHLQGKTEGYTEGKTDGIEEGYNQGYADGKAEGGEINLVELDETPKMGDGENNIIEYKPSNYNADGFSNVKINVTSVYHSGYMEGSTESYNHGYNDGYEVGKSDVKLIEISDAPKMTQVNSSNNLVYTPSEYSANGFSKVNINVTNIYDEGYNEGYAEGQGSSAGTINVKEVGIKFGRSTFAELPPYYDFKDVTNMDSMFDGCENLRTIPEISTSNVTTMEYTFGLCKSLTTIPMLDTSNVTDMSGTFSNCQSLITIPELNTSMVWSMNGLFHGCTSLTSIPYLDTSRVADMQNMFAGCKNLTSVPNLTTDKVEYMTSMFSSCESLTTIPELNTSNVIGMNYLLSGCINLVSVPPLNAGKVNAGKANGIEHFFGSTELPNLTDFGGLIGLKSSMTDNYGFVKTPNLSYQSCINILNGLYNFKGNGLNPNVFQGKLKVHKNFLDLVGDEISIATNKGWTITA